MYNTYMCKMRREPPTCMVKLAKETSNQVAVELYIDWIRIKYPIIYLDLHFAGIYGQPSLFH